MSTLAYEDGKFEIEGGQLVLARGDEEIRLRVLATMRFWRGEWFANRALGVPYLQKILTVIDVDLEVVNQILRNHLLSVPGVVDVEDIVSVRPINETELRAAGFHDAAHPFRPQGLYWRARIVTENSSLEIGGDV